MPDERTQEVKDLMLECYEKTRRLAEILFPERFYLPFSEMHDKIFEVLDDDSIKKVVITAFRGFGKTSIVDLAFPAKKILFRDKKFIPLISCTATQAVMQSENLKNELLTNPDVNKIFGSIRPAPGNPVSDFSKEAWVTDSGTLVLPRGAGQQVRGILFGNHRPDLIIVDDLENSEEVMNEEYRLKLKKWFFSDVLNSVSRHKKDWKVVFIGTLLHEDSLLATLMNDKEWAHVDIPLFDPYIKGYKSNWPQYMSDDEVKSLVEEYRDLGLLDTLYKEYANVIKSSEAGWNQGYFKYYEEPLTDRMIETIIIVDPAKSATMESAHTAIEAWGINLADNKLYLRDLEADRLSSDSVVQHAFDMADAFGARVIGVETTGIGDWIKYSFMNAASARGRVYEFIWFETGDKGKERRASWLLPMYKTGHVFHNKAVSGPLEAQMLSFPYCKRWDCLDAAAYVIKALEEGQRYFFSKSEEASEEEYKTLLKSDDESPLPDEDEDYGDEIIESGRWRSI
jgi:hypothetical protein